MHPESKETEPPEVKIDIVAKQLNKDAVEENATKMELVLDPSKLVHAKPGWNLSIDYTLDENDQPTNSCLKMIFIFVWLIMFVLFPSLILIDERTTYVKLVVGANFLVIAVMVYFVFIWLGAELLFIAYILFYIVVLAFMYERYENEEDAVTDEHAAVHAGL